MTKNEAESTVFLTGAIMLNFALGVWTGLHATVPWVAYATLAAVWALALVISIVLLWRSS